MPRYVGQQKPGGGGGVTVHSQPTNIPNKSQWIFGPCKDYFQEKMYSQKIYILHNHVQTFIKLVQDRQNQT